MSSRRIKAPEDLDDSPVTERVSRRRGARARLGRNSYHHLHHHSGADSSSAASRRLDREQAVEPGGGSSSGDEPEQRRRHKKKGSRMGESKSPPKRTTSKELEEPSDTKKRREQQQQQQQQQQQPDASGEATAARFVTGTSSRASRSQRRSQRRAKRRQASLPKDALGSSHSSSLSSSSHHHHHHQHHDQLEERDGRRRSPRLRGSRRSASPLRGSRRSASSSSSSSSKASHRRSRLVGSRAPRRSRTSTDVSTQDTRDEKKRSVRSVRDPALSSSSSSSSSSSTRSVPGEPHRRRSPRLAKLPASASASPPASPASSASSSVTSSSSGEDVVASASGAKPAAAAAAGKEEGPEDDGYRRENGRGTKRERRDPDFSFSDQRAQEGRRSPPGKKTRDGLPIHLSFLEQVFRLAACRHAVLTCLGFHDLAALRLVQRSLRHVVSVQECVCCRACYLDGHKFNLHKQVCGGFPSLVSLPLVNHDDWSWTPARTPSSLTGSSAAGTNSDVIGTGAYGTVRVKHYAPLGADVAVKTLQAFPSIRSTMRVSAANLPILRRKADLYDKFEDALRWLTRKHLIDAARNKKKKKHRRKMTASSSNSSADVKAATEAAGYETVRRVCEEYPEILEGLDIDKGVHSWQVPILTEINVLRGLGTKRHVLRLLEAQRTENPFHLVHLIFHLYPDDLAKRLKRQSKRLEDLEHRGGNPAELAQEAMTWVPVVRRYARQLLKVVALLHKYGVAHQDVKPGNIFLDETEDLVLGDFGMASLLAHGTLTSKHKVVTVLYRAPELLRHSFAGPVQYTKAVDVWSVGCVIAEMLMLQPLFHDAATSGARDREALRIAVYDSVRHLTGTMGRPKSLDARRDAISNMMSRESPFFELADAELFNNLVDLLARLLDPCPDTRITARAALFHPLFATESAVNSPAYSPPPPL